MLSLKFPFPMLGLPGFPSMDDFDEPVPAIRPSCQAGLTGIGKT